jgi:preprotein translocase SecE subunit
MLSNESVQATSATSRAASGDDESTFAGLHKPGQGYWTRMLTACLLGVLTLSAAAWAFQELTAVTIPTKEWNVTVTSDGGAPFNAGDVVEFHEPGASAGEVGKTNARGTIRQVQSNPGQNSMALVVESVESLQTAAVPARDMIATVNGNRALVSVAQAVPYFELLYLQATVVGIVLITGAIVIYWLVGVRTNSVEFLIATDGEMKKVNWSTRKEILGSTWVVIGACFLIAGFLFIVDTGLATFFELIGLLKRG